MLFPSNPWPSVNFLEHIYSFNCPRFYTNYHGFSPLVMTRFIFNLLFFTWELCCLTRGLHSIPNMKTFRILTSYSELTRFIEYSNQI